MNRVFVGARDYRAVSLGQAERLCRTGLHLVAEGDGRVLKLYAERRRISTVPETRRSHGQQSGNIIRAD